MSEFLKGKKPLTDKFRIQRNVEIYKSLKKDGKKAEAEELKQTISLQIKKYREIYGGYYE